MRTKSVNIVFSYFRPTTKFSDRPLVAAVSHPQTRPRPIAAVYIRERAQLNREAHFLAGVLSAAQLGGLDRFGALRELGVEILSEAYRALQLNPNPSAKDIRKIERIRAAISRFLVQAEKRAGHTPTRGRQRVS